MGTDWFLKYGGIYKLFNLKLDMLISPYYFLSYISEVAITWYFSVFGYGYPWF
jgi:hypothetical protein